MGCILLIGYIVFEIVLRVIKKELNPRLEIWKKRMGIGRIVGSQESGVGS